jgi:hypothetical protein
VNQYAVTMMDGGGLLSTVHVEGRNAGHAADRARIKLRKLFPKENPKGWTLWGIEIGQLSSCGWIAERKLTMAELYEA